MSELNDFLNRHSGGQSEEGGFTLNPDRAMELVGSVSSDKPFWFLAPLLQALFLDEVRRIEFSLESRGFKLVADLSMASELKDGEAVFQELGQSFSGERSRSLLGRAIAGCRADGPTEFSVATPGGSLHLSGQPHFSSNRQTLGELIWQVRYPWGWLEAVNKRTTLLRALREWARFYPLKLDLDGRQPEQDWPTAVISICCEAYTGGGCIGFVRPDLSVYQEVEEELFLYSSGTPKPQRPHPAACTVRARNLHRQDFQSVISITSYPDSRFFLVRHGVLLETLSLQNTLAGEAAELGLLIVADFSDFKVDVSGLAFVRNEEFLSGLRALLVQARELNLAYLRHVDPRRTSRLKSQKGSLGILMGLGAFTPISHLSAGSAQSREDIFSKLLASNAPLVLE